MEKPLAEDIDIERIKKKSFQGVIALTSRTFVLQIIAFGATFLLTIFLSPAIFGVFYVVSAIISFLGYFSDVGLAAALIQKKEYPTKEDLETTFTIQQILVGSVVIVALLFSQFIAGFYHLDDAGLWLFRALVISFFLSSLKTIPSILLERKLDFHTLVLPQILETLGFYIVAVTLAWRGFGVASFSWAVLCRAVVGLIVIYLLAPWKISFGISRDVARKLLHFGIPFQLNSFLALLKDDLLTVFLGKILPFSQIGYIGWAKKWAEVPLRLVMDSVVRVTFPAFSRIQYSKEVLGSAIEKTLFGIASLMFPITVVLIFFVQPVVTLIPRYGKWEPALFSFYLFALGSVIAGLTTPLTNALNAVGKIRQTLYLMIFWTISTWILVGLLVHVFGFNGVAMALLLVAGSIVIVVKIIKQYAAFSLLPCIVGPTISAFAQGLWYVIFRGNPPYDIVHLALAGVSGAILYGGVFWLVEHKKLKELLTIWKH